MPLVLDYTAPTGTNYPSSYWVIKFHSADDPNSTGSVVFHGYPSAEIYDTLGEASRIGEQAYSITDPAVYDAYFARARYANQLDSYFITLEGLAQNYPSFAESFFNGSTNVSPVVPSGVTIGASGSSVVIVAFPAEVGYGIGGNYTAGVAVEVDAVPAVILSVSNVVFNSRSTLLYEIDIAAGLQSVVTWAYDGAGFLDDGGNIALHAIQPQSAINRIGEYMKFNDAGNSSMLAAVA